MLEWKQGSQIGWRQWRSLEVERGFWQREQRWACAEWKAMRSVGEVLLPQTWRGETVKECEDENGRNIVQNEGKSMHAGERISLQASMKLVRTRGENVHCARARARRRATNSQNNTTCPKKV